MHVRNTALRAGPPNPAHGAEGDQAMLDYNWRTDREWLHEHALTWASTHGPAPDRANDYADWYIEKFLGADEMPPHSQAFGRFESTRPTVGHP